MLNITLRKKNGQQSTSLYYGGTAIESIIFQWKLDLSTKSSLDPNNLVIKSFNNIPSGFLSDKPLDYVTFLEVLREIEQNPITNDIWYKHYTTAIIIEACKIKELKDIVDLKDSIETPLTTTLNNNTPLSLLILTQDSIDAVLKYISSNVTNVTNQASNAIASDDTEDDLCELLNTDVDQVFAKKDTLKHPTKAKVDTINKRLTAAYVDRERDAMQLLNPDLKRSEIEVDTSNITLVDRERVYALPTDVSKLLKQFHTALTKIHDENKLLKQQNDALLATVLSDSDTTGALELEIANLKQSSNNTTDTTSDQDTTLTTFLLNTNPNVLANPSLAMNLIYQWLQLGTESCQWFLSITKQDPSNQLALIKAVINLATTQEE